MLDLDGDGLELCRASASILFDHDADDIRTGTGWIGSDDGILVRDLDGNDAIDTGRELFGIDTVKLNGQRATDGFDALADLDINADGQFTSADFAWNSVKLWRDLDQDGVSDAGELFTLDALGITRVGVVGSTTNATGGAQAGTTVNGNAIAQSASFTQTVAGLETTRSIGAVDLESNAFYRQFTTAVPLTDAGKALPGMQGSGRARDLREAASLSPTLAATIALFAAAPNDTLSGGTGNNVYLFGRGDGADVIANALDTSAGKLSVLRFKEGVAPGDITLKQQYSGYWGWAADLELDIAGSSDKITIGAGVREMSTGSSDYSTVQKIEFADGTVWDTNALKALLFAGTAGADTINGTYLADTIHGAGGADTLSGRGGDDTLDGGAGDDALQGEAGNDSYVLARGSGQDTVSDYDATAGNTDVALFGADVAADRLWFRQVGNSLEVSVIGSTDKLTVSNWYSGSSYHVEQFKTGDGKVLLDTQVQNLVQAMAGFAPPASGQTTLPASYQNSLNPVIAANWQ